MTSDTPWDRWFASAADPAVRHRLKRVWDDVDAAVRERGPTCWTSGKCCDFDPYGHRMYLTGLEITWAITCVDEQVSEREASGAPGALPVLGQAPVGLPTAVDLRGPCPFQVGKTCGIHAIRPMGCRVYFCQAGTADWQQVVYEQAQSAIRQIHDDHDVPYSYMEWRAGLAAGLAAR